VWVFLGGCGGGEMRGGGFEVGGGGGGGGLEKRWKRVVRFIGGLFGSTVARGVS